MPHFRKRIETAVGDFTFDFNRIYTVKGPKYHVSVKGPITTHYFMMDERNGSWKVSNAPLPPQWVIAVEKELEEAILEHQG